MTLDLTQGVTRAQLAEHVLGSPFGSARDYQGKSLFEKPMIPAGIVVIVIGVIALATAVLVAYKTATIAEANKLIGGMGSGVLGLMGFGIIIPIICYVALLYLKKMSQEEAVEWLKDLRNQLAEGDKDMVRYSERYPELQSSKAKWDVNYSKRLGEINALLKVYDKKDSINN